MFWPHRTIFDSESFCWAAEVLDRDIFNEDKWHCTQCSDRACIDRFSKSEVVMRRACVNEDGRQSEWAAPVALAVVVAFAGSMMCFAQSAFIHARDKLREDERRECARRRALEL